MGRRNFTTKQFIKAIPGSGGIISTIAERVGCDWITAKKWIHKHPSIFEAYEAEIEKPLDLSESVVIANIQIARKLQQSTGAIQDSSDAKWYLVMKGKGRGFTQRQEVTGADGGAIQFTQVEVQLTHNEPVDD